ncbi:hypothetical protein N9W21_04010 [Shewanella sp.]|nr:hypothetical protein [Shewanella sp.]
MNTTKHVYKKLFYRHVSQPITAYVDAIDISDLLMTTINTLDKHQIIMMKASCASDLVAG